MNTATRHHPSDPLAAGRDGGDEGGTALGGPGQDGAERAGERRAAPPPPPPPPAPPPPPPLCRRQRKYLANAFRTSPATGMRGTE